MPVTPAHVVESLSPCTPSCPWLTAWTAGPPSDSKCPPGVPLAHTPNPPPLFSAETPACWGDWLCPRTPSLPVLEPTTPTPCSDWPETPTPTSRDSPDTPMPGSPSCSAPLETPMMAIPPPVTSTSIGRSVTAASSLSPDHVPGAAPAGREDGGGDRAQDASRSQWLTGATRALGARFDGFRRIQEGR